MKPLEALANDPRPKKNEFGAAEAAAWLANPSRATMPASLALWLEAQPEWTGADYGSPENPERPLPPMFKEGKRK